jgi:HAD superfamily hydrolase (TIGR01490 family)
MNAPITSPEKIGAFFDLDGTLLGSPSLEWRFIAWLAARDEIGSAEIGGWLAQFAKTFISDPRAAIVGNKRYLAGLPESLVKDWENSLAPNSIAFFECGIERVAWHAAQGHRVFLVSGTLAPLGRVIARQLSGSVEVCATEVEARDGRWTGRITGEHVTGEAKSRAIRNLAARFELSLWDSYAYGNSVSDLPMLDSVGHRMAVNAAARLRRIACNEGWQSCDWNATGASPVCARGFAHRTAR